MKRIISFLTLAITLTSLFAVNNDSIAIKELGSKIERLEVQIEQSQKEIRSLNRQVSDLNKKGQTTMSDLKQLSEKSEKISSTIDQTQSELSQTAATLDQNINKTQSSVEAVNDSVRNRTLFGVLAFILAMVTAGVIYVILKKRITLDSSTVESIKATQEKILEESMKLDNKMIELMEKQLAVGSSNINDKTSEPDHSLALKVADEIVRIELNLSKMDSSVKGHKQLSKAVERIKNNFLAQGYEIVDMLGKPYNEGMKVVANFVSDETIPEGSQIITGIIKPQILFNGKMIQAAQITVSQNI